MASQTPGAAAISIAWRRLDAPGHDSATLSPAGGGWLLEGAAAFLEAGTPCHLCYRVELDRGWRTRSAEVRGWAGARVALRIGAATDGQWTLNDAPVPAVSGCIDIDLAFTPATNLLPIRRLALPAGASAKVVAAWLRFPELVLEPLDQVYLRSGDQQYGYRSLGGTFETTLSVSPHGFVTDYPGLWIEERG